MLYESFQYCLEACRRQHMRQHDENEKNESENLSEWKVSDQNFKCFPSKFNFNLKLRLTAVTGNSP